MLGLDSSPNAKYSDKTSTYYLINACTSQTSVNYVSNNCVGAPSEGTIIYRLRDLDPDEVQHALNPELKNKAVKTVEKIHDFRTIKIGDFESIASKVQFFAVDFVNIPFYGMERTKETQLDRKQDRGSADSMFMPLYT